MAKEEEEEEEEEEEAASLSFLVDLSTTLALHSAPRGLHVMDEANSSVTIGWREDSCARAYVVTLTNSQFIIIL